MVKGLHILLLFALMVSPAWAFELDRNNDGKVDDIYIPSILTRDSELSAGLAGKQNTLGYTPENSANKGVASGYAGLGTDGKVPAGQLPSMSGLSSLPSSSGQSLISTGAAAYGWLENVPLATNPANLLNASTGVLDLSGFQPYDSDLNLASSVGGSGNSRYFGTNPAGVAGVFPLPGAVVVQTDPPTSASDNGIYCATSTAKCYARAPAGIFNLADGTYIPDPVTRTLTITTPSHGVITCVDQDLSTPINCGGVNTACTATTSDSAIITGITATADSGYAFSTWIGEITGAEYNTGTVTLSVSKEGSANFALSSGWLIADDFSVDTSALYTKFSGSATLSVNTSTGKAYNATGGGTSVWTYRNDVDLMSANQVVQAVIQDRISSTSGAGTGLVLRGNGTTGHGCWPDIGSNRFTCDPLGGSGTTIYKSWASGAWAADAAHLVQISVGADNVYKFEVDFNDDGDFLDADEQVGNSTANASYTGTRVGIGSRVGSNVETVDNFKAKVMQ